MDLNKLLRNIPKIDDFLADSDVSAYRGRISRVRALQIIRKGIDDARTNIAMLSDMDKPAIFEYVKAQALTELEETASENLRRVINATGIIIHTNLGRAPLSLAAADKLHEIASGYSNLEYSVVKGVRRSRLEAVEKMLCDLSGAEAAHVVNNNAAAVLLALNTLASGHDVVLSRSEIVEIGDSFRINEIIETAGCKIKEVGTSNITKLRDYEKSIGENTAVLLKVHRSNFKITGFTEETSAAELKRLAQEKQLLVMEDMGSGVLTNMTELGLCYERSLKDAVKDGIDIITISGDKLLGGPQAGIIFGKKTHIDRLKRNQLSRCLRADKLCLAALEAVLCQYFEPETKAQIPVLYYASLDAGTVKENCRRLIKKLNKRDALQFEVKEHKAELGGGTMPGASMMSFAVAISAKTGGISKLEKWLRSGKTPIVGTLQNNELLLDLRTVERSDFDYIAKVINDYNV